MLLVTKLMRPRVSRWHLPRLHLSEILQEGLSRRLTALIAAAGHGKTCTLGHFLAGAKTPYVWMQLDSDDSNIGTFLHYLAQGIREELGAGSRLVTALEAGGPPQNTLPLLIADLNDCQGHVAIVLDDFHLIEKDSLSSSLWRGCCSTAASMSTSTFAPGPHFPSPPPG